MFNFSDASDKNKKHDGSREASETREKYTKEKDDDADKKDKKYYKVKVNYCILLLIALL